MKVIVTGAAGFIGMHVCMRLLERGDNVIGLDNLNGYYSTTLKDARLQCIQRYRNFSFIKTDISQLDSLTEVFRRENPEAVVHLAAQAGVRYSLQNPHAYTSANLVGFANILDCCRIFGSIHLVYASSSSVYGGNSKIPFSVQDRVDRPLSLYAATKKANELMAHSYSHIYNLPTTGLRYFTVYGPWGRPDMSPWIFTEAINEGRPIPLFNSGNMRRDFTYIDDISDGTVRALDRVLRIEADARLMRSEKKSDLENYKIYNIGNSRPENVLTFIRLLEKRIGKEAVVKHLPMQSGDVLDTFADIGATQAELGFAPSTVLSDGVSKWVDWYLDWKQSE
jgi:UDP-glucuronate 4-epimerase